MEFPKVVSVHPLGTVPCFTAAGRRPSSRDAGEGGFLHAAKRTHADRTLRVFEDERMRGLRLICWSLAPERGANSNTFPSPHKSPDRE
ncbi:hypothetical protein EYF80_057568 [Liparis tanakae]|uniref:Uncharacterized protein n=1 Tax=Liparis tanakae TaxID=230148 RepID=A0A4Z2EUF0_9TELE|nr:hypothetical protein EYF80_057568 [Liparis tanakae]